MFETPLCLATAGDWRLNYFARAMAAGPAGCKVSGQGDRIWRNLLVRALRRFTKRTAYAATNTRFQCFLFVAGIGKGATMLQCGDHSNLLRSTKNPGRLMRTNGIAGRELRQTV